MSLNVKVGHPGQEIEFRVSLPEIMLLDLIIVQISPLYEGYQQWIYSTYAALKPDLKKDIETFFAFMLISSSFYKWLITLPEADPARHEFSAFIGRLQSLTDRDFCEFLRTGLAMKMRTKLGGSAAEISIPYKDDPNGLRSILEKLELYMERLVAYLRESGRYEEFMNCNVNLLCDPAGLRDRMIKTLTAFWEQWYREEYTRSLPVMERSAAYHRAQNYMGEFADAFHTITGRPFPPGWYSYFPAEKVIFLPSCHVGPQVGVYVIEQSPPLLLYSYKLQ